MKLKTKLAVITSNRADYGLLRPLLFQIHESSDFQMELIVTGAHLHEGSGHTLTEIQSDPFLIAHKISIMSENGKNEPLELMAHLIPRFKLAFEKSSPDFVLVLGDRYEIFISGLVCYHLGIPLVHLHGGEISSGSLDDGHRHCLTQLASLHFPATTLAHHRIIRMGQQPESVFCVGALGLENIRKLKIINRESLELKLNWKFHKRNILFCFHPEMNLAETIQNLKNCLEALAALPEDWGIIVTAPNPDAKGTEFMSLTEDWVKNRKNVCYMKSLGNLVYLNVLRECDILVGNSSSGIIEAGALETWTLNIGSRQKNRECGKSVFHAPAVKEDILEQINRIINREKSQEDFRSPYGEGDTSERILKVLKTWKFSKYNQKEFYDGLEKNLRQ